MAAYYISLFCCVRNQLGIHRRSSALENNNIIKNNVCAKSIELIGLYVLHLRDTPIEIESKIKCCSVLLLGFFFSFHFISFLASAWFGWACVFVQRRFQLIGSTQCNRLDSTTNKKTANKLRISSCVVHGSECSPTLPLFAQIPTKSDRLLCNRWHQTPN